MSTEYCGLDGVRKIASLMRGDENILIGVRPFGFHAGNLSADVVYPLILCEELKRQGKEPYLNITFFMNDYEQYEIVGHRNDPDEDDEVNIYPKGKTLQYEREPLDNSLTVVDYWSSKIISHMDVIRHAYPNVMIKYQRTSDLRSTDLYREVLNLSLNKPNEIASIFKEVSGKHVHLPAEFARVVCVNCEMPVPGTQMNNETVRALCDCGNETCDHFSKLDYWVNHNLLGISKLSVQNGFFLWMLGYDHKQFHSGEIKARVIDQFGLAARDCNRVYAPLLLREDGRKMSKSSGNIAYARIGDLLENLRRVEDMSFTMPDSQLFPYIQEISLNGYQPK